MGPLQVCWHPASPPLHVRGEGHACSSCVCHACMYMPSMRPLRNHHWVLQTQNNKIYSQHTYSHKHTSVSMHPRTTFPLTDSFPAKIPQFLTGSKVRPSRHPGFPGQILVFCLQTPLIFTPVKVILFLQPNKKLLSKKLSALLAGKTLFKTVCNWLPLIWMVFLTDFTRIRAGFDSHQHFFHNACGGI